MELCICQAWILDKILFCWEYKDWRVKSIDPDEVAHDKPPHLALYNSQTCLHGHLC